MLITDENIKLVKLFFLCHFSIKKIIKENPLLEKLELYEGLEMYDFPESLDLWIALGNKLEDGDCGDWFSDLFYDVIDGTITLQQFVKEYNESM